MTAFLHGARIYELIGNERRPIQGMISELLLADMQSHESFEIAGYAGGEHWSSTLIVIGSPAPALPIFVADSIETTAHHAGDLPPSVVLPNRGRLYVGETNEPAGQIWEVDPRNCIIYLHTTATMFDNLHGAIGGNGPVRWSIDEDDAPKMTAPIVLTGVMHAGNFDGLLPGDVRVSYVHTR